MNKIFTFLFALLLVGCAKEEQLEPKVNFENPYVILDDPNDPVTHKRYELYQKYGVPVFFSDTIARVYINNDVLGNPVYGWEKIDLNWSFNAVSNFQYTFEYIGDTTEMLRSLNNVDTYLNATAPSLRPFSVLLVKSFEANGNSNVMKITDANLNNQPAKIVNCVNGFRSLVIGQVQEEYSNGFWNRFSKELLRVQIKRAITTENYSQKLSKFKAVSMISWYDKYWNLSNNNLGVDKSFNGSRWRLFDPFKTYSAADEQHFLGIRKVFGRFGFIGHSSFFGWSVSPTMEDDVNLYVDALLNYNNEKFMELWNHSSLVMEKHDIIYDIIENDMKVPLADLF